MRAAGAAWIVPTPVVLWVLVLAGHTLSAASPVPALLEEPARVAACAAGILSLACGYVAFRGRPWLVAGHAGAPEWGFGCAALLLAGVALGAEADRRLWPLPVHPREVRIVVEGRVLDTAAIDARAPLVPFEVLRVRVGDQEASCRAKVALRWGPGDPAPGWITPGLWLRLGGSYRPPEDARNFGGSAPGRWAERAGLSGTVRVDPTSVLAPAAPPVRGAGWDAFVRDEAARAFSRRACEPIAALSRGMLLGDRSGIDPDVRNAFRDGGTIHVLSISGLHVVILAGFIAAAATALRLPAGPAVRLELAVLWAYVLLVGAPASALRSALLWTSIRAGRAWGRIVRPFAAWGLAGLLLHLVDPRAVLDPGFQLSFAAVLGLGASTALAPVRPEGSRAEGRLRSSARGMVCLFVQSAGASAGTAALQGDLFGAVPLSGLLLNLAVIPLCTLFMAESILAVAADRTGVEALAAAAGGALDACGLLLLWLHAQGARMLPPWILRESAPLFVMAVSSVALLVAWATGEVARAQPRGRRTACAVAAASFVASLAAPVVWAAASPAPPRRTAVVVALDVGQGDATWIGLRGRSSLLIDAGPEGDGYDAGSSVVEPALRAERSGPMTFALLSHAHSDHYGGFPWLSERGWIETLHENGSDPGADWRNATACRVVRDTVLWRGSEESVAVRTGLAAGAENDRSLTAVVRIAGMAALFPGDLETAGEESLLCRAGDEAPVRLLKAPHHGSHTSSGAAWVATWSPEIVIISCGERNRFRHPDLAVVGRYLGSGARVLRTDREGSIRVTLAPHGAWISTRADPAPRFVPWTPDPG